MNVASGSALVLYSAAYRITRDHFDRVRLSTFAGSAVQRMIAELPLCGSRAGCLSEHQIA